MPASGEESLSQIFPDFSSFCLINVNFHLVKCQAPSNINSDLVTGNLPIAASPDHHPCPIITIRAHYGKSLSFREINVFKAMPSSVCSLEHESQNKIIRERGEFYSSPLYSLSLVSVTLGQPWYENIK